jgi:hypothetical protein
VEIYVLASVTIDKLQEELKYLFRKKWNCPEKKTLSGYKLPGLKFQDAHKSNMCWEYDLVPEITQVWVRWDRSRAVWWMWGALGKALYDFPVNIKHFRIDIFEYAQPAKTKLLSIHRLFSASTDNRNLKKNLRELEFVKT